MGEEDILLNEIRRLRTLIAERVEGIAELYKGLPALQDALAQLDWMSESQEQAPPIVRSYVPEGLMNSLGQISAYLNGVRLPPRDPNFPAILPSASGTISSDYAIYADEMGLRFPTDPAVTRWVTITGAERSKRRDAEGRSNETGRRLGLLHPLLAELHSDALGATKTATTGVQRPIEAAEAQRELLVQFKGELLRRCKQGRGATYVRIADNLALRNDLTVFAIQEQQHTYDFLHERLAEIAKGRIKTDPTTMSELLALLEDHIIVVTTACDRDRLGVSF